MNSMLFFSPIRANANAACSKNVLIRSLTAVRSRSAKSSLFRCAVFSVHRRSDKPFSNHFLSTNPKYESWTCERVWHLICIFLVRTSQCKQQAKCIINFCHLDCVTLALITVYLNAIKKISGWYKFGITRNEIIHSKIPKCRRRKVLRNSR